MAFPPVFQENYEDGSRGNWDAETDSQSILSFPHYSTLARQEPHAIPFRGNYACQVDLAGHTGTTAATLQHNALDMSVNTTRHFRWYMYVSNLVIAASDRLQIFSIRATNTEHVVVEILNSAGSILLRAGQNSTGGTLRSTSLTQNTWLCVELSLLYDGDGSGDGTIDFFVQGAQVGAQLTALTQAASTRFNLGTFVGATGVNTGITSGIILFDEFMIDDERVYPFYERFPQRMVLTESGHVAAGPGRISEITLLSGGAADNTLRVFDSDAAVITDPTNLIVPELRNMNANETVPWDIKPDSGYFNRGVYVDLTGTDPRAMVTLADGLITEGAKKSYARRRSAHAVV